MTDRLPAVVTLDSDSSESRFPMSSDALHNEALREANEQLVIAALRAQDLLAAAVLAHQRQTGRIAIAAHELRNPLAPIRTAAALLGLMHSDEKPLRRLQVILDRQVDHLTRLVDDLLDVSRISLGKLRIEPQSVDIVDLVRHALVACLAATDARHQLVDVDVPQGVINVIGDPVRLTQVLANLLDNASKYTAPGGTIGIGVVVEGESVGITVSDTGIGIAADAMPSIFEPFVQDELAVHVNGHGLGIGLTLVRELVNAHGGGVMAFSAGIGFGSRFVVTLPRNGPPSAITADADQPCVPR